MTGYSRMNTMKSKNSHRNRLLSLLVDQQQTEFENQDHNHNHNNNQQHHLFRIDDDDAICVDEDSTNDYQQIMKSNFSICSSTFANFGETGGGGGGCSSLNGNLGESKRKRANNNLIDQEDIHIRMEVDDDNNNNNKSCTCSNNDPISRKLSVLRDELLQFENKSRPSRLIFLACSGTKKKESSKFEISRSKLIYFRLTFIKLLFIFVN